MENQDFTEFFNEINHISLNYNDLLNCFLEYIEENHTKITASSVGITVFNQISAQQELDFLAFFLEFPSFLEAATLSARQAVVLGILTITLENKFLAPEFEEMCRTCHCQGNKQYFLEQTWAAIEKQAQTPTELNPSFRELFSIFAKLTAEDKVKISAEFLKLFTAFEKESYSKILSKNKDLATHTGLSKRTIDHRQQIFQSLLDNQLTLN